MGQREWAATQGRNTTTDHRRSVSSQAFDRIWLPEVPKPQDAITSNDKSEARSPTTPGRDTPGASSLEKFLPDELSMPLVLTNMPPIRVPPIRIPIEDSKGFR